MPVGTFVYSAFQSCDGVDFVPAHPDKIKRLINNAPDTYSGTDVELNQSRMFAFQNAVNEGTDFLKE